MEVLPATDTAQTSHGSIPAGRQISPMAVLRPPMMRPFSSLRPPGESAWWMRASTSGPMAIWGLSKACSPRTWQEAKSISWSTTRVVPRSTAIPVAGRGASEASMPVRTQRWRSRNKVQRMR